MVSLTENQFAFNSTPLPKSCHHAIYKINLHAPPTCVELASLAANTNFGKISISVVFRALSQVISGF